MPGNNNKNKFILPLFSLKNAPVCTFTIPVVTPEKNYSKVSVFVPIDSSMQQSDDSIMPKKQC